MPLSDSTSSSRSEPVSDGIRDEGRIEALAGQNSLGTEPEPAFDLLDTEAALVNFVAEDRQWAKSAVGVEEPETGLDASFCAHTVTKGETVVVENAVEEEGFADNPYVTEKGVRFYAGVPLQAEGNHRIGTLCVLDSEPRTPSDEELRQLTDLAGDG